MLHLINSKEDSAADIGCVDRVTCTANVNVSP